jgi:dTDP-glucose 4,6-dehydratase
MQLLVTGGCGFIGSNFVRLLLTSRPDWTIHNVDALTYAGNPANLTGFVENFGDRYRFYHADIADAAAIDAIFAGQHFDAVVNFAAESHVDRSISGPMAFIQTNVVGTAVMLDAARRHKAGRFLQVSTDEVYGSLGPTGLFTEQSPLQPSSPYSASKTSSDLLALAHYHTFGQDVLVTRCSNNYGPYQFPEKLIPLMITNALADLPLPVYGDGKNVRDWIHVEDHCEAVLAVLERGRAGEVYNIGGDGELPNIDVVHLILEALGKPASLIKYVADRLGHDRRYAIDSTKTQRELGWMPRHRPHGGIRDTVAWYVANRSWWEPLRAAKH